MDIQKAKMVQRLRGSYQIAMLLTPLVDASQRHISSSLSQNVKLEPASLLREVFSASNKVYQHLATKDNFVSDPNFVMHSLNVMFSKALRNNIVLYGSDSLDMLVDDVISVFDSHLLTLQQWSGGLEKSVTNGVNSPLSRVEKSRIDHDAIGFVSTSLLSVMLPFHIFHSNLFLVGKIAVDKVQSLNSVCSGYMISIIQLMKESLESNQKDLVGMFSVHSVVMCSEICAMHCYELHGRIIKSVDDISRYINDPIFYLEKIAPLIMSSLTTISYETAKMMEELVSGD